MATFIKQVQFEAFQFNMPEVLAMNPEDNEYAIEDAIIAEIADVEVRSAHLVDKKLVVVLYTYGGDTPKTMFELNDGDWLITTGEFARFAVVTDNQLKELTATA